MVHVISRNTSLRELLTQRDVACNLALAMTMHNDLAKLLRDTLEERCQRNPKYSLRAFARDLGVPAPRLSRWLKGQDGLSRQSATQLAKRLGLSPSEIETFVLFMESKHARAKKVRENAREKLKTISGRYQPLDVEAFKVIADWYHFAVMSLVGTENFKYDAGWIAKRLGISIYEVKGAISRLLELGMLEEDSQRGLRQTQVFYVNPTGTPSKYVRSFHQQILEKAKMALEFQTVDERDFSALVLAVDPSQVDEAKVFIKKFREEFESKFCNAETKKKEIYALSTQFFRLSESGEIATKDGVVK